MAKKNDRKCVSDNQKSRGSRYENINIDNDQGFNIFTPWNDIRNSNGALPNGSGNRRRSFSCGFQNLIWMLLSSWWINRLNGTVNKWYWGWIEDPETALLSYMQTGSFINTDECSNLTVYISFRNEKLSDANCFMKYALRDSVMVFQRQMKGERKLFICAKSRC